MSLGVPRIISIIGVLGIVCLSSTASARSVLVRPDTYRSLTGYLRCSLFAGPSGFPASSEKATMVLSVPVESPKTGCYFEGLKPGTYAVAMMHDENNNEKMDTTIIGMPAEGWAVTNNAGPSVFGPPSFDAAKFELSSTSKEIVLKLRY